MSPERNGSSVSVGPRIPSSTRRSNRSRVAPVLAARSSNERRQLPGGTGAASGNLTDLLLAPCCGRSIAHCVARVAEVEMDTIPEHLHHVSAVVGGDLVDQLSKTDCNARSFVVPGLLGEPRVAGEIGESCGLDPPRGTLADPGFLKCSLH